MQKFPLTQSVSSKIVCIMKLSIVQQKQGNRYSASKLDTEMTKNSPSLCHLVQHKATAETKECCCPPSDDLKRCEKVKKNQKKIHSTHAIRIKNEKYSTFGNIKLAHERLAVIATCRCFLATVKHDKIGPNSYSRNKKQRLQHG